ncbi:MAG: hypothetical protein [Olavius algarvensis Gamma 1 endosymbiont]|nr:MAG: hypothetical protein [Olavius algarvensis Gamma 1 endosymbiont]
MRENDRGKIIVSTSKRKDGISRVSEGNSEVTLRGFVALLCEKKTY